MHQLPCLAFLIDFKLRNRIWTDRKRLLLNHVYFCMLTRAWHMLSEHSATELHPCHPSLLEKLLKNLQLDADRDHINKWLPWKGSFVVCVCVCCFSPEVFSMCSGKSKSSAGYLCSCLEAHQRAEMTGSVEAPVWEAPAQGGICCPWVECGWHLLPAAPCSKRGHAVDLRNWTKTFARWVEEMELTGYSPVMGSFWGWLCLKGFKCHLGGIQQCFLNIWPGFEHQASFPNDRSRTES